MTRLFTIRAGLLAAWLLPGWAAAAGLLNDTGITQCANLTQNGQTCPQAGFPLQDAETGRDAQAGLSKVGAGPAGFDFTKLGSSGQPLADDALSWDCVRDNVTGLIWEIKTNDNGLRDLNWRYTWCNKDSGTNGGAEGFCDTGSGVGSDNCFDNARCDTEKYPSDVNALTPKLCGFSDWRMPTREELLTIVDYSGFSPAIATGYFPRTLSDWYWSASPYAPDADSAWGVLEGWAAYAAKGINYFALRLVRGGP